MHSFQIRRATLADSATIVEFNTALAFETEAVQLDRSVLELGVAALLNDAAKGFYTLAEDASGIVGQTLITYEWSDWRNGWYWWIQSVFVAQHARSQGVFKAIYQHLLELATQDRSVIGLRLYVEQHNEKAQAVYRAFGMELEPYQMMGLYPLPGRSAAWATSPTVSH